MARYTRNTDGKAEDARSGWRARRDAARAKREGRGASRAEIAAARAAYLGSAQVAAEVGFNPGAQPGAPAADDYITNLSDKDLAAYYEQLHGRKPNGKAKRVNIEAAVRKAEIDRKAAKDAADAEAAAEETGEEPDDEEFRIDREVADEDDV